MINGNFPGLAQRGVYYFIATFPPFSPAPLGGAAAVATAEEQAAANAFIYGIYARLYDDPALLGLKILPDDSYGPRELKKAKPALAGKIRGAIIKIEEFIALLYSIALNGTQQGDNIAVSANSGDFTIKAADIKQLEQLGITASAGADNQCAFTFPAGAAAGLSMLARISKERATPAQKPYLLFSRGVFNPDEPWTAYVYRKMFAAKSAEGEQAFDRLIKFLDGNGYTRVDNRSIENRMAMITLDYAKDYAGAGEPLKWAWGERSHGGIELIYQEARKDQPLLALRVPYFAELLRHSDVMPAHVKDFILKKAKKCDNCRYCVQTDKTGKKPLKYEMFEGQPICPMFCGFQFRWSSLDGETAGNIIAMLSYIDDIFKSGGPGEAALKRWA